MEKESNCCGEHIMNPDAKGHGRCSDCKEHCCPAEEEMVLDCGKSYEFKGKMDKEGEFHNIKLLRVIDYSKKSSSDFAEDKHNTWDIYLTMFAVIGSFYIGSTIQALGIIVLFLVGTILARKASEQYYGK